MLIFFWILGSMGVAYWAKLDGRSPAQWFLVAAILSPLVASIILMLLGRQRR